MAQFIVRDLEEAVKTRLKRRAARHGRSIVKRHPESTPRRHEELTPFCLLRLWPELMSFFPILLLLQLAFAEDRCGAFPSNDNCRRGS